jgi:predicted deacylase
MLDILTYTTTSEGPVFTVLGAVHGDEKCGTEAIHRIVQKLDAGELKLSKGTLVMIPITNPRAYAEDVRFIDRNLNRCMHPEYEGTGAYEDSINPILCPVLAKADYLLDLHSYTSPGNAFIFLSGDKNNSKEIAYATSLGVYDFVHGWQDAFGNSNADVHPRHSTGIVEYAREEDAIAITFECGQHKNADAPDVAETAILRALHHLGMINIMPEVTEKPTRCVRMKSAFQKVKDGAFAHPLKHYDAVKAGDVLARYADGEEITAPEDVVV